MSRHRKSDPQWRTLAAAEVMASCVPELGLKGRVLLAGEAVAVLRAAVQDAGCEPSVWLRRASAASTSMPVADWPGDGPFAGALLRLPRAKEELDMMLHAAVARVTPGGPIGLYGANDEGIRSISTRFESWLGPLRSIAQRAHCRVLLGERPTSVQGLRPDLSDWKQSTRLTIGGTPRDWISYPGVFARGGLDDGTRLLLGALAKDAAPASLLDFGCGTGVISAHILAREPGVTATMADSDALAITAASRNVPAATGVIATSLKDLAPARYDLIVSNPPIHDGKSEDYTVLGQLIAQAPAHLTPRGRLVFVVQRRVPVAEWLQSAFDHVEMVAEDNRFTVWRSSQPKVRSTTRGFKEPRARSNATPGRGR